MIEYLASKLGRKLIQISYKLKKKKDKRIDTRYNVQTCTRSGDNDLVNKTYVPCPNSLIKKMFLVLPIEEDDYFFDFGCGKGRVMLWAGKYIKSIGGVERDKEIFSILADNVRTLENQFIDTKYNIHNMDVRDFDVDDNITYAFFYDPFPYHIFYGVCRKLIESYERNNRKLYLIYCNEKADITACIQGFGVFEKIDEIVDETIECAKCFSIKIYRIGD